MISRRFTFLIHFFFNDTATTEISPLPLHDALPIYRNARLINSVTLNHTVASPHAQRVFLPLRWIRGLIVPHERQRVVVVAIVGITIPVARESDHVCRFFEAPIANQLGVQSTLDALEHKLEELAV